MLSTPLYFVCNDLLDELQTLGTADIPTVFTGNPAFADDLVCIGTSPYRLQILLNCSYNFLLKWRFDFNPSKSVVISYCNDSNSFKLGLRNICVVNETKHLVVHRSTDPSISPSDLQTCRKDRKLFCYCRY